MNQWKVIGVLLAIIIALSVIIGVKVINNTPEKQEKEFLENYNENKIQTDEKIGLEAIEIPTKKELIDENFGKILIVILIGGFELFCIVKILKKMGIEGLIIKAWMVSMIAAWLVIFTYNSTLENIMVWIAGPLSLIMIIKTCGVIGVNPWWILGVLLIKLIFGGLLETLADLIIYIYGASKLCEYFGKGTLFQLGMIFLPVIFLPILAFSEES